MVGVVQRSQASNRGRVLYGAVLEWVVDVSFAELSRRAYWFGLLELSAAVSAPLVCHVGMAAGSFA